MFELLKWDSDFFGIRVARVTGNFLTPESSAGLLECCRSHNVDCLYLLAESTDPVTAQCAQEHGFTFVDVRLTYAANAESLKVIPGAPAISGFDKADLPYLRRIARSSHQDSRFYFDQRFSRERCDDLFDLWIERSCSGWASAVFVARQDGEPVGYCTCHTANEYAGSIGLIAVRPDQQGRGLGQQLVCEAARYFRDSGIGEVSVATQARNRGSQRLYQNCGFRTGAVQVWYHRWFDNGKAGEANS